MERVEVKYEGKNGELTAINVYSAEDGYLELRECCSIRYCGEVQARKITNRMVEKIRAESGLPVVAETRTVSEG